MRVGLNLRNTGNWWNNKEQQNSPSFGAFPFEREIRGCGMKTDVEQKITECFARLKSYEEQARKQIRRTSDIKN